MTFEPWIPVVAAITSAAGAFFGTWLSARKIASSTRHQAQSQVAMKIADFRQAWIHQLRDAMCEFQSYGVTPELDHAKERNFYKLGTKIELLMNRKDPLYDPLAAMLYKFLRASTIDEKYSCNAEFISLAQDILKREWETLKIELREAEEERPPRITKHSSSLPVQ